ncbi:alpha/beta fold hydrolase [Marinobacteraceae bacterium S3BR75-40.1]
MIQEEQVELWAQGERLSAGVFRPQEAGQRPALVISHGAIGCKEQFYPMARQLAGLGLTVLVPDMRGHGGSDGARYHVEIPDWKADILASLDWLQAQDDVDGLRLGALGFSSGGTAVLEAAMTDDRIKAIVTLDATVRPILSRLEIWLFRGLGSLGLLKRRLLGSDLHLPLYPLARMTPSAVDPAVNQAVFDDPHIKAGYWHYPIPGALDSFVIDTLDRVGAIKAPVCVLHGEEDRVDSPETARALFRGLTCEKALHLVPGSGHMGHLDQSRDVIYRHAAEWLQRWLLKA